MEQGQYREDNFGNSNQGGVPSQGGQTGSGGQPGPDGQTSPGGWQGPGGQAPFIPMKAENGPVKQSQAKAIIILLVCILAVNVATFVTQNFLSPRGMVFSGAPGADGGGIVTQGGDTTRQQAPPDFEQE